MKKGISHYDYIIVGGGSAGCVLANRLSKNPSHQVCLVEAGPRDWYPYIQIPAGAILGIRNKKTNWHYLTTPQKNCNNRSMSCPRGRTLGGGSSVNAMCYTRGNAHDYNEWASLGCDGWSHQDILPYFIKMENFEPGANAYHGVGGPMNVAVHRFIHPLMPVFIEAGKQAGYTFNSDYNAEHQEGVSYFYVTQKNGERCSNAKGYLNPIEKRKNLTVMTETHTTKILFDGNRAAGVRVISKNKTFDLFADKEVILSAGAIGSPQILMLSGVGPRAEIEKHGIPIIHDLPGVGKNLQDHLNIYISCLDKTHTALSLRPGYLWRHLKALYHYFFKNRQGEMTSNYAQATGFFKSDPNLPAPDLQWHFIPIVEIDHGENLLPLFKYYGYSLLVCHLHPLSRGNITLRDPNPLSPPLIDPNYLDIESDLDAMVTGFKKTRELLAQPAFIPYHEQELLPGETVQSDEDIKQYIRNHSETIYHPVGTCKMGKDDMSVVDPTTLKIWGLENIRVIDASIMPTLTSGNTNAPTTMIAEKGAEMILNTTEKAKEALYDKHDKSTSHTT